ncbi:MAG: LD-carboxypeptidase [Bowdeniella nasicola]|nr:LD-carboxypeptidase [Bowdeniella nasicola]
MSSLPQRCPPLAADGAIAVLSPSMAGPAYVPAIPQQAMRRLRELTGRQVVEYPTTAQLHASASARATDISAAFDDPQIGAIMSTIGGNDLITVLTHLDESAIVANPKPFFGYSANTHLHNWLWQRSIASFYGGSTQVHLGTGPKVDREHSTSLLAALNGGDLEIKATATSEDYGIEWSDPRALTHTGERTLPEPWRWSGPEKTVRGHTWGGCVEVLVEILIADRFRADHLLDGAILLLETSEEILPPPTFGTWLRALGERGILARLADVIFARPPATSFGYNPPLATQASYRRCLAELVEAVMQDYNPQAVVCCGLPCGHTRPQWILPYGGQVTLDGTRQRLWAHYR